MFDERIKLAVAVGFLVAGVLGHCVSRIKGFTLCIRVCCL